MPRVRSDQTITYRIEGGVWEREQIEQLLMAGKIGILGSGAGILALGIGGIAAGVGGFYALKEAYQFGQKIAEDMLGNEAANIITNAYEKTTILGWLFSRSNKK
jgi:hypothetical protein